MEPMTMTATAIGTLLLVKIGEGAATKAGEQLFEKLKGLLTPQFKDKANKLLLLLRREVPKTAKAIEQAPSPPLNVDATENELKQAIQNNSQLALVVEEVDTFVKANPNLMQAVKEVIDDLKSQPSSTESYNNTIEKVVNLVQGTGASININRQDIRI